MMTSLRVLLKTRKMNSVCIIILLMRRHTYLTLEHMMKHWTSPVYAFYCPIPDIIYVNGQHAHVFRCAATSCKYICWCFLDGPNCSSASNLIKHIKMSWGDSAYKATMDCQHGNEACKSVIKSLMTTGTITMAFNQKGRGKVSYRQSAHKNWNKAC